eukprot:scaffold100536_cov75-Phaeocystis_antarctica.AAC.1
MRCVASATHTRPQVWGGTVVTRHGATSAEVSRAHVGRGRAGGGRVRRALRVRRAREAHRPEVGKRVCRAVRAGTEKGGV